MPYDHTDPYAMELDSYRGPVDRISPFHFYQYTYWNLRGYWRRVLYDWTRRAPCDVTATIDPKQVLAGENATVTLTLSVHATPIGPGSRIAVYTQKDFGGTANACAGRLFQGPDGETGYGHRVTAHASREDVSLRVRVHSTGSAFACFEVFIEEGTLETGDTLVIVMGDPSCKPPVVCEHAKALPFRVAVDTAGDGTFRPVQHHPMIRIVGARARELRCFAPATPAIGEPFDIRVVAADAQNHNPSFHHSGELTISASEGEIAGMQSTAFPPPAHGTLVVPGLMVTGPDVSRIRVVDEPNSLMGQTNPVCPEAAPEGLRLYYGEIHSHTELSDGTGTAEDNYRWARDAEGLDFAALADHFEDGQSYNYTLEDKWRITKEVTERFNEPGRFVTLLGYEIGTLEAHRNVYFRDGEGRMVVEDPGGEQVTMNNVYEKLEGMDYILIPHAPKFHGINWDARHRPDCQRLVEICSNWGISEDGGEGRYKSVRHALEMGYKFGFTGGTDNHFAEPGNAKWGGFTGVWAESLSREAIFDALMQRRTFALYGGQRMILRFSVHGTEMGGEAALAIKEKAQICARVIAEEPIARIDLVGNGEILHTVEPKDTADATLEWEDPLPASDRVCERPLGNKPTAYYYLRTTSINGALGWSSPVWVSLHDEDGSV